MFMNQGKFTVSVKGVCVTVQQLQILSYFMNVDENYSGSNASFTTKQYLYLLDCFTKPKVPVRDDELSIFLVKPSFQLQAVCKLPVK